MFSVSAYFLAIPPKDLVLVGRDITTGSIEDQSETFDTESYEV